MKEAGNKEPAIDFTQLASGGDAPEKPQAHSEVITDVKMQSGEWISIEEGSFKLYKTNKGVPFVEFKIHGTVTGDLYGKKIVQLFPATVAGWAFKDDE